MKKVLLIFGLFIAIISITNAQQWSGNANISDPLWRTGNVGIGLDTALYKLDVNGDINTTGRIKINGSDLIGTNQNNLFFGNNVGFNTTGTYNIFFGQLAGQSALGDENIYMGYKAGNTTNGQDNMFLGNWAGEDFENGNNNVFLGTNAGSCSVIGGDNNVMLGFETGSNFTSGNNNIFLGKGTGGNAKGADNILIGQLSGRDIDGGGNVFIGKHTGLGAKGDGNFFMGYSSGYYTEGNHNMFLGYSTGKFFTNGDYNVFLGYGAGHKKINTASTGDDSNVLIGHVAGYNFGSGTNNVFIGSRSGYYAEGDDNLFLGSNSGVNTKSSYNVFIGPNAGRGLTPNPDYDSDDDTPDKQYISNSGTENTFIGNNTGQKNTTGSKNLFSGAGSGLNNTTGSKNLYLGTASGVNNITGSNNVFIGNEAGYYETEDNKLYLANARIDTTNTDDTQPMLYGEFDDRSNLSDSITVNRLGINTTSLDANSALTVGGNLAVTGTITINGEDIANINSSVWTQDQSDNDLTYTSGNVIVGTNAEAKDLYVTGMINTTRVKVDPTITVPDYVFADDYELPTLSSTENYIKANHHLPEIPSAKEMEKEGIDLGVMNLKLLKKIEELTLHMIDLKKENQNLKGELKSKDKDINAILERLSKLEQK